MSVISYDGLYKFPTDIGDLALPKFTVDTPRSNTWSDEIQQALRSMSSLEGSVLFINDNGTAYAVANNIGLSAITAVYQNTCELQATGNRNTWYVYINGSRVGTFSGSSVTRGYYGVSVAVIVECTDGYVMMSARIDTQDAAAFGFTYPEGDSAGYFVYNGSLESLIVGYPGHSNTYCVAVDQYFRANPPEPFLVNTDPYAPGGTSGTGGGTGNFDLSSDAVDFPGLPTLSAVDTGLVTIYTPTLAQMRSLANYMWNADVQTVEWWKKLVANPLDLILGLSIVPVTVPAGATQNIKVGFIDTGISMTKAAQQFVEVDCGSLSVTEFSGSALDYSPFRKTSIYLPFIGTRTLSTDDIMGKTVQVKYHIDILSGALTAMIKAGDAVLYQYSGSCSISLPLTGQTFTDMITSTIQLAAGIAGTVAGGGAVAGASLASAANNVMSMKPHIERAGGVSGPAGQLGIMRPYLIGEIPRQSVPANYNEFAGYPSNIKAVLGDLTGFTQVETVYLSDIAATDAELEEIDTLLKEGVFINAA